MSSILSEQSAQLIANICDDLPAIDAASARDSSSGLCKNAHDGFYDYFVSFKVSFCQQSLGILVAISQIKSIALVVEHITFGTETLDQYFHLVYSTEGDKTEEHRATYSSLLLEELHDRKNLLPLLREALLRFPNLKSIKLEDRPSGSNEANYPDYCPSFGSAKLKNETGIDLAWNGPFPMSREDLNTTWSSFPTQSRSFVYAVIFALLRDLEIEGKRIDLDLVIGGYTDADGRNHFTATFDPPKALPRRIIDRYLRKLEIRDVDMETESDASRPNDSLREFLDKITFDNITFNRCIFRGWQLERALCGFDNIALRNCTDVQDLGSVIRENRSTLSRTIIENVDMPMWHHGTNHCVQFFRALCMDSAIQYVKLDWPRTDVHSVADVENEGKEGAQMNVVAWKGRSNIRARAQVMARIVNKMALRIKSCT